MNRGKFLTTAGLVFALWLFGAPDTAYGQGNTWAGTSLAQMVESARWRIGAFRVNAALQLINTGYDTDIYFGYLDEAIPDFTFAVGTPVQVFLPMSKKVVLEVFDSPQYSFYFDTKQERAWNNTFRSQVHMAMEKFYIQAGGGLSNVRRRLSPELNVNIREKTNRLDGLVLWQVSRQTSLAMIYGGADFDYGDAEFGGTSIAEALNRRENYFDLAAYVQPNPRIRFFLDGQYGTYAFPEETPAPRDARSYGIFGGFEFTPREGAIVQAARFGGSVNLGYMRFDMKDPQFVDGSGVSGAINLTAEILRRTTVRVLFSRGFEFSVYSGASYYVASAYGGGIAQRLSRRASLSYQLSFGQSDYPEDEAGGGTPQRYRYTTHSAALNIMLARNLTITFQGMFAKRGLGEAGARNRNFFGLSLVYGAPAETISAPAGGRPR